MTHIAPEPAVGAQPFHARQPPKPSVACANAGDVSSCLSVASGALLMQVQLTQRAARDFSPMVNFSVHSRTVLACSRTIRTLAREGIFPTTSFSAHSRTVLVCKVCGCSVDNTVTLTNIAASESLC